MAKHRQLQRIYCSIISIKGNLRIVVRSKYKIKLEDLNIVFIISVNGLSTLL